MKHILHMQAPKNPWNLESQPINNNGELNKKHVATHIFATVNMTRNFFPFTYL